MVYKMYISIGENYSYQKLDEIFVLVFEYEGRSTRQVAKLYFTSHSKTEGAIDIQGGMAFPIPRLPFHSGKTV